MTYKSSTSLLTSPFFLGFDNLFKEMDRLTTNQKDNFPPYNLYQRDGELTLELALAGYKKENVSVTVEGDKLTISGDANKVDEENPLIKGIARRSFRRQFILHEGHEVKDATMADGLLTVTVVKIAKSPTTKNIEVK